MHLLWQQREIVAHGCRLGAKLNRLSPLIKAMAYLFLPRMYREQKRTDRNDELLADRR